MKCGHPMCNRGIGLVSHRRWFGSKLYCSRACRDNYAARPRRALDPQVPGESLLALLLFKLPDPRGEPAPAPSAVRVRAR